MRRNKVLSGVAATTMSMVVALLAVMPLAVAEDSAGGLYISQFKVTSSNGQFFELRNTSSEPIDMSKIQLAYYNHYDVSKATSSKLVSLSGVLAPGGYYLVHDSATTLCYQTMVASASLNFSSTAGMVQVHLLAQIVPGGPIVSELIDSTAWSKAVATGAQTMPSNSEAFLLRQWGDEAIAVGGGSWIAVRPSLEDPCKLESVLTTLNMESEPPKLLPGTSPPVRYVAAASEPGSVNRNIGKMTPIVNELFPDPKSPQTDAADEFIELYNPNDAKFDLSGFKLAFGSAKPRKYTIPEGTIIEPKSFMAFTSGDTSISLSNSGAQVWLLDQNEQIVSQSEPYGKAVSGHAWALNNDSWGWTAVPTPGEINAISGNANGDSSTAAVLGVNSPVLQSSTGSTSSGTTQPGQEQDAAPLHPAILAGVGLLAVGYALYEYRQDMANRLFQFRRYLRHRREARQAVSGQ